MVIKTALGNLYRYKKYYFPVFILLFLVITIPIILSGTFDGMKRTIIAKLENYYEGEYPVFAYTDIYLQDYAMSETVKDEIDSLLYSSFSSYKGSRIAVFEQLNNTSYFIISDDTIPEGVLVTRSEKYKTELSNKYPNFQVESDNSYADSNAFINTYSGHLERIKANYKTACQLLEKDPSVGDLIYLEFSKKVDYEEVRDVLSKQFTLESNGSENSLIARTEYTDSVVLLIPNLDTDIYDEVFHLMDSGYAGDVIDKIFMMINQSSFIIIFLGVFASLAAFITTRLMYDQRKREYITLRLLGGSKIKIFSIMATENLLFSLFVILIGGAVVLIFASIWVSRSFTDDYIAMLFAKNGHYIFLPNKATIAFSIGLIIIIPFLSALVSAFILLRGSPLEAQNKLYGGTK